MKSLSHGFYMLPLMLAIKERDDVSCIYAEVFPCTTHMPLFNFICLYLLAGFLQLKT